MYTPQLFVLLPLFLAPFVSAHGFVHQMTIAGKDFLGNTPSGPKNPSIIREISSPSPVKGAKNPDVNCGASATAASQVADANPGDVMTFDWKGADLSNWPHNTGPMLTYLANCGSTTCDQFDAQSAKWFKIGQIGLKANGGQWVQADLMNGATTSTNLPATLAPGNYLVRHEIIALHLATQVGGAEFYTSCSQIRVGGSATGAPTADELVSLPGAYSDNDPGIFVPDVFNGNLNYQFPGPAIASFINGAPNSVNAGNSNSTSTSTTTSSGAQPTTTSTPSKGKSCKLKKSTSTSAAAAATASASAGAVYPRHLSRVMRRLVFDSSRFERRSSPSY